MYIHKESAFYVQWDTAKNQRNFQKHKIWFDEAATVLYDKNALEYYDQEHSSQEDRFWIIGKSHGGRILLVVYSLRSLKDGKENYYRIISARVANKKDRHLYEAESRRP